MVICYLDLFGYFYYTFSLCCNYLAAMSLANLSVSPPKRFCGGAQRPATGIPGFFWLRTGLCKYGIGPNHNLDSNFSILLFNVESVFSLRKEG